MAAGKSSTLILRYLIDKDLAPYACISMFAIAMKDVDNKEWPGPFSKVRWCKFGMSSYENVPKNASLDISMS